MPFKVGTAPVRRTVKFLHAGRLKFKKAVAVLATNYNVDQKASIGAYEFTFWHYPQIYFQNRHVQLLKFKNMTPTPCIQILMLDGQKFVVDVYDRSRQEIHDHLLDTFCVGDFRGKQMRRKIFNPAAFGYHCKHWCICEFPGQVPCPCFTPLPKHMRGKYKYQLKEDEESELS